MPEQVRIDAFLYASGASAGRYDRLHRAGRIAVCRLLSNRNPRLAALEMSAKFIRQRRQYRHITIGPALSMDDVNLRWVTIQKQILDPDMHEFVHPGTGLEQRLDHQSVFASAPVGGLNQALNFALLQAGDRAAARMRGLQRQPAANPLHDIFGLIVTEMMFAPEAEGVPDDFVEGMRDRLLTTHFRPGKRLAVAIITSDQWIIAQ